MMQNWLMTTFATSLKKEVARIARKELRDEVSALRKSSATYRSEIAELKRRLNSLESRFKSMSRTESKRETPTLDASKSEPSIGRKKPGRKVAFGPADLLALRQKLGFTQAQMGELIGASSLSIYKWESGQVVPRAAQLEKIFAVRKIGKREAMARLGG
jgi:DNA-binding transcriptional regulator YiaG